MTVEMILKGSVLAAALLPGLALLAAAVADVGGPPVRVVGTLPAPLAGRRLVALRRTLGCRTWAVEVPRGFALVREAPAFDEASVDESLRGVRADADRLTTATGVEFVHLLLLPGGWPRPAGASQRVCTEADLTELLALMDAGMEPAPTAALALARGVLDGQAEVPERRSLLRPGRVAFAAAGAALCAAALATLL